MSQIRIFGWDKILKARGVKLSTIEKIDHLLDLQRALEKKLEKIQEEKEKAILKQVEKKKSIENPEEQNSSVSEEQELKQAEQANSNIEKH